MGITVEKLREKGWPEEDIQRAARILQDAPVKKSPTILVLDKAAYWGGLFLAIIGNFVISVLLIPFLILMKSFYLYLALMFLGVIFGWVFSILMFDIESIKEGQHVVAWIFIPTIALVNVFVMTNLANHVAKLMEITTGIHQAPFVSVVYVFSFMFPYTLTKMLKK